MTYLIDLQNTALLLVVQKQHKEMCSKKFKVNLQHTEKFTLAK